MKKTVSLLLTVALLLAMLAAFAVAPVSAEEAERTPLAVEFVSGKVYENGAEIACNTTTLGKYYSDFKNIFDTNNKTRITPFLKQGMTMEVVGKFAQPTRVTSAVFNILGGGKRMDGVTVLLSKDGVNWETAATAFYDGKLTNYTKPELPLLVSEEEYNYVKVFKSGNHINENSNTGTYFDVYWVCFYNEEPTVDVIEATYTKTLSSAENANVSGIFDLQNKTVSSVSGTAKEDLVEGKLAHPTVIQGFYFSYSAAVSNHTLIYASVDGVTWKQIGYLGNIWGNVTNPVDGDGGIGYIAVTDPTDTTAYNYIKVYRNQSYASGWKAYGIAIVGNELDAANGFGFQTKIDADAWSLRLIAAVDSLEIEAAGFEITATGAEITTEKAWDRTTTTVYTGVYAVPVGEAAPVERDAAYFDGAYVYTAVISGISIETYGAITFTVKPYVLVNGVKQYSAPRTIVINDGVVAE